MNKRIVLLSAVILFAAGSLVKADQLSDLKQQMEQQNALMQQMQQKLAQLEAQQTQQTQQMNEKMDQQIAKAIEEKKIEAIPDSMKWWIDNVKLSGDLRYRYEMVDAEGDNKDNRNLNRIRARLGLTTKVNDEVEVGFRLATSEEVTSSGHSGGNPTSTNQTLDDAFSKKAIWLDLAYFKWSPKDTGLNIIGGKMENPFFRVGGNQLIWDSDLTPEGIAVQYTKPLTENDELFINGGGFWVNEVDTTTDSADTGLFGIQGDLKHTFDNKSALIGGASYYSYGNIEGSGPLIGSGFQGNSNANNVYTNEYDIAELFGEYDFNLGKTPAALFASAVNNPAAASSADSGWLIGGKLGKCKDPGSWEFSYDYRDLEADAVLGAFSDSDFVGGGTNGKGHRFGIAYQLAKNLQGGLCYFLDKKGNNEDDYNRLQADITFKF